MRPCKGGGGNPAITQVDHDLHNFPLEPADESRAVGTIWCSFFLGKMDFETPFEHGKILVSILPVPCAFFFGFLVWELFPEGRI